MPWTESGVRRRRGKGKAPPNGTKINPEKLKTHDGALDDDDGLVSVTDHGPVKMREYLSAMKWWDEEYRCALVCITGSVLLGLMLRHYDNQLVPDLPWGLNFDMVIVAIMTGVRVALKSIVEASISQGAWIWVSAAYQQRRSREARLEDFKVFDEASRGL
jgi:Protein of unknown function (DUF3176)